MSTGPARAASAFENEAEIAPIDFSKENRCPRCRCIWSQGHLARETNLIVRCPRPRCGQFFAIIPSEDQPRPLPAFGAHRSAHASAQTHACITCRTPFAVGAFGAGSALFIVCRTCKTENRLLIP